MKQLFVVALIGSFFSCSNNICKSVNDGVKKEVLMRYTETGKHVQTMTSHFNEYGKVIADTNIYYYIGDMDDNMTVVSFEYKDDKLIKMVEKSGQNAPVTYIASAWDEQNNAIELKKEDETSISKTTYENCRINSRETYNNGKLLYKSTFTWEGDLLLSVNSILYMRDTSELSISYNYTQFDERGNWLERTSISKDETSTEKRVLVYY